MFATASGQTLYPKDIKLTIPGRALEDLTITVQQLLKIDRITGNFPWLSVNEITVVVSGVCINSTGVNYETCPGNLICEGARELLKMCRPGAFVFIESYNTTNKSGVKLSVSSIMLKVIR